MVALNKTINTPTTQETFNKDDADIEDFIDGEESEMDEENLSEADMELKSNVNMTVYDDNEEDEADDEDDDFVEGELESESESEVTFENLYYERLVNPIIHLNDLFTEICLV